MAKRPKSLSVETDSVDINGAQLVYDVAGLGPPLVFIHAGVCNRRMWDDQIAAFATDHRVMRYDVRGFGESSNPPGTFAHQDDLVGLLDAVGFDRVTLIAVSMAGQIALKTALTYPERIGGLVLSTTNAGADTPSDAVKQIWREADAAYEAGNLPLAVEIESRGWVDGPFRTPEQVNSRVRVRVAEMNTALWERIANEPDAGEEAPFAPAIVERLAEITVPTLLIVGDFDQPMTVESMARLGREIAGAETVVIEGTGHLPSLERPDEFNRAVRSFLAAHDL